MKYSFVAALSLLLAGRASAADIVHFTCSSQQVAGPKTAVLTLLPTEPSFRVQLGGVFLGKARVSPPFILLDDGGTEGTYPDVYFDKKDTSFIQFEIRQIAKGWFGSSWTKSDVIWNCKAAAADKAKLPALKQILVTLRYIADSDYSDHGSPAPVDNGSDNTDPIGDWGKSCQMSSDCTNFCNNGQCT